MSLFEDSKTEPRVKKRVVEHGRMKVKGVSYEYLVLKGPFFDSEEKMIGLLSGEGLIGGGLNGYVRFPKRPTIEQGYGGILTYVPVHGGITYAEESEGGIAYGFDTAHYNSDEVGRKNPEWIKGQIRVMTLGILKAAEVERKYLHCITNRGKAKHIEVVQSIQPDEASNCGVSINLLGGEL